MVLGPIGKFLGGIIRAFDLVTRKRDTYPTILGGLLSIGMIVATVVYASMLSGEYFETTQRVEDDEVHTSETEIDNSILPPTYTTHVKVRHQTFRNDPYYDWGYYYLFDEGFALSAYWDVGGADVTDTAAFNEEMWQYDDWFYYRNFGYCNSSVFPVSDWTAAYWQDVDLGL